MGLLIAFIALLSFVALAFIRGLFRGWKQGTYRLLFLSIFAIVPLCLLGQEAVALGGLPLSSWVGEYQQITINGVTIEWHLGNLNESIFDFAYKYLTQVLHVSGTAQDIANYATALTGSVLRLLMVFLIAFVTLTVGSFLAWILWHIAFKHFIPKARRRPTKRWISGLEDAVVYVALAALCVIPFSGLANALNKGSKNNSSDESQNETIALINAVLNTFDNSIFNKAFFAWTAGDGSKTLDTQIAEFFAQNSYLDPNAQETYYANIIKEINVFGNVLNDVSALMNPKSGSSVTGTLLRTTMLVGASLYSFASHDSVAIADEFAPLTFDLASNLNLVKEELGPSRASALSYAYENGCLNPAYAAQSYELLAASEVIDTVPNLDYENISMPAYSKATLETDRLSLVRSRANMESSINDRALINALVAGYVHSYYDADPALNPSQDSLSLLSVLPRNADGTLDELAFAAIDWWKEATVLYDAQDAIQGLQPYRENEAGDMDKLLKDFLDAVVGNAATVISILIGERVNGVPRTNDNGENIGKTCLLDSDLVSYLMPGVFEVAGYYLDDSVLVDEQDVKVNDRVSALAVALKGQKLSESRRNYKGEMGHILDVLAGLTVNEAGRTFLKNYSTQPGIDMAEDGTLIHLEKDLARALMTGLGNIDSSKLLTLVGPDVGDHFARPMVSEGGSLYQMGIEKLDFHCPNLGQEITELVSIADYCNDMVSSIGGLMSNGEGNFDPNVLLDALAAFETPENHYQVTHFMDLASSSAIINPEVDGRANANIAALFNYIFESMGENYDISIDPGILAKVTMESSWNGDVLDITKPLGESFYILNAFRQLVQTGVIENLANLSGHSSEYALRQLSAVRIDLLFEAISHSYVMREACPEFLDELLIGTLLDSDGSLALEDIGVSYYDLVTPEDWVIEGVALQNILNLAVLGLDLSDLDLFNPSVMTMMEELAASRMFFVPEKAVDAIGEIIYEQDGLTPVVEGYVYVFQNFLRDKLLHTLTTADDLKLYTDYGKNSVTLYIHGSPMTKTVQEWLYSGIIDFADKSPETLDLKKSLSTTFCRSIALLSSPEDWIGEGKEFSIFRDLASAVQQMGGVNNMDSFSAEQVPAVAKAFRMVSRSRALGQVMIGNLFDRALSSDDLPDQIKEGQANTGWFFRNADEYLEAAYNHQPTDAIVAARNAEIEPIVTLMNIAMTDDSLLDEHGNLNLNLANLPVESFLRPLLTCTSASKVMNPQSAQDLYPGEAYDSNSITIFENFMLSFLKEAQVYVSAYNTDQIVEDYVTPVAGTNKTLKDIVNLVNDWEAEKEMLCELVLTLQGSSFLAADGTFNFDALSDLSSYFSRVGAKEELTHLLNTMEESELFYRCLPPKLDAALQDGVSGAAMANLAEDLSCADFYCNQNGDKSDFTPYETEEIISLVNIFESLAACASIDLSNLSTVNVESLTNALIEMGCSRIFNSNTTKSVALFPTMPERHGMTAVQALLCDTLLVDALNDNYFSTQSPKDIHYVAEGAYWASDAYRTDCGAATKMAYNVKSNFKALSDTYTAVEAREDFTQYLGNEWGDCIRLLQRSEFASFVAGDVTFEDLPEDSFASLLHTLNESRMYRDCVPNALYEALVAGDNIEVEGVFFESADVWFSYYMYDDNGNFDPSVYHENPSDVGWNMPFYAPEIDQIVMLYNLLKDDSVQSAFSDLKLSDLDPLLFRDILLDLQNSYIFHEGARLTRIYQSTLDVTDFDETVRQFRDLTVFEQFIFKILKDTTLTASNFNANKDYEYSLEHTKVVYDAKLDAYVLTNLGEYFKAHDTIKLLSTLTNSWLPEIEALTTDNLPHAGGDEGDPSIGIIRAGIDGGIFESGESDVNVSFDALNKIAPGQIKNLLYAVNESGLLSDVLPNNMGNLLNSDDSGDGLGMDSYTETTFNENVAGQTEIDLSNSLYLFDGADTDATYHSPDDVTVAVSGNPEGHFRAYIEDTDITSLVSVKSTSTPGTYVFGTKNFPKPVRIELLDALTFASDAEFNVSLAHLDLGHDGYLDHGIKGLGYLMSSAYRGTAGGTRTSNLYFSFAEDKQVGDDPILKTFFEEYANGGSDFQHSTYGLLSLFGGSGFYDYRLNPDNSFAKEGTPDTYSAGAYALYNALEFEVKDNLKISIPLQVPDGHGGLVDKTISIQSPAKMSVSKYIGQGDTPSEIMSNIEGILASCNYNDFQTFTDEAIWFDRYATSAGTFDVYNQSSSMAVYQNEVIDSDTAEHISIDYPTVRYNFFVQVDKAFVGNDAAYQTILDLLSSTDVSYSIQVPDGEAPEEIANYGGDHVNPKFGENIVAGLLTASTDYRVKIADLGADGKIDITGTTFPGSKNARSGYNPLLFTRKYTRIGNAALTLEEEGVVHFVDDYFTQGLTDADYMKELRDNYSLLHILSKDAPLNAAEKADVVALYQSLDQGNAAKFSNLFYLICLYDHMIDTGLYYYNSPTDNLDFEMMNDVLNPFSFGAIASSI